MSERRFAALRLTKRRKGDKDKIKAFGQGQLCRFLTTARDAAPDAFAAFAVMGLAGLRVGEAMALKWEHLGRKADPSRGESTDRKAEQRVPLSPFEASDHRSRITRSSRSS